MSDLGAAWEPVGRREQILNEQRSEAHRDNYAIRRSGRIGFFWISASEDSSSAMIVSRVLILAAAVLSIGLLILAMFLPVVTVLSAHAGVQPRESLVASDGWLVLLPAAVPLAVSGLVGWLIRTSAAVALVASVALLLASLIGFATFIVGVFALPVGILLVVASTLRLTAARRPAAAR
jgi:hypothetical protein